MLVRVRFLGNFLKAFQDPFLNGCTGQRTRWTACAAALKRVGADVIAIAPSAILAGIGRRHGGAARTTMEKAFQVSAGREPFATPDLAAELVLHLLPNLGIYNCLMFPGMGLFLVLDFAPVNDIGQQVI